MGLGQRLQHGDFVAVVHQISGRLHHFAQHVHQAGARDHNAVAGLDVDIALYRLLGIFRDLYRRVFPGIVMPDHDSRAGALGGAAGRQHQVPQVFCASAGIDSGMHHLAQNGNAGSVILLDV